MNKKIIYLKEVSSYDDILKNKHAKMPLLFKKIVFLWKNIFNIITKKRINDNEIWILPIKEKYPINKIKYILGKESINSGNIYLVSKELKNNQTEEIMDEYKIEYLTEEKIKKILIIDILKYIVVIQKKEISDLELSIMLNNPNDLNLYLIEELAKLVRSLKIVSLNIYKFKKLEEKLYKEYGIAIQFSNSYKKSLEKSRLIINFDFNELEINEYEIFEKAIIINCTKDNLKIKSRLFNGIIINSCDIEYKKEIIRKFKEIGIYDSYKKILLYSSIINHEENIFNIFEKLKLDNVNIINLIGNSGAINKKEFKNIEKSLTKIKKQSNI